MTGIVCSMVGATYAAAVPASTSVDFDGTGDYYQKTSISSSGSSATKFVVAITYNTDVTAGQTHMVNLYSSTSNNYGFYIWINNGRSQLVVTSDVGSEVYNVYTGTSTVTIGAWEQLVWYFDMASFANTKCYKNGSSQSLTQASFNGTLSLNFDTVGTIKIGQENTSQTSTGSDFNGKIAQLYINRVTAEPSINSFWDSSASKPKDLGTNGTLTGLAQPYIYHYGNTATFPTNNGTGFNAYTLTANGNVSDADGPSYA